MSIDLKYGCNPHQKPAQLTLPDPPPLRVLNGTPSYINILDALSAWQLVRELREATGKPAAASFKHVSPAGAAVAGPLSDDFRRSQLLPARDLSPIATAYARARGGDRMSSFGDAVAVSDPVDVSLAHLIHREVSDLIIAPDFGPEAMAVLKEKRQGKYLILRIDPGFDPPERETRSLLGFSLEQPRNSARITPDLFSNVVTGAAPLPDEVVETLIVATIALKYTQSNSVCVAYDGQVIGMGAGQQSRVHCTRLACAKADKWLLQQHPRVLGLGFRKGLTRSEKANVVDQFLLWDELSDAERAAASVGLKNAPEPIDAADRAEWIARFDGVCLSSDAYIPFRDNIDRASRSNVQYIAQPGQSLRDDDVMQVAREYGMAMVHTGLRLFTH